MRFATAEDATGFEVFKLSGHAESTQIAYDNVWVVWCEYLTSLRARDGKSRIDKYLTNVDDIRDKCYVWGGFVYYLRGKKGKPSQRVASHLAAVKHKLSMQLTDLSFTDKNYGPVKMSLLAAARRSKEEILATLQRSQRTTKLPAPDELTEETFRRLWTEAAGFDNYYGIHNRAVALCNIFMDITGNRTCNLIKCKHSDHTIRAQQVTVTYRAANGEEVVVHGGSAEVAYIDLDTVIEVSYTMLTSKVKSFRPIVYTFRRGDDARSDRVVTSTAAFMKHSGAAPEDPFATYVRTSEKIKGPKAVSKRTVTAQDINDEICVSARVLGLPEGRFSFKSYREALATKNRLAGVRVEETCRLGGWNGPRTVDGVYDHSEEIMVSENRRGEGGSVATTSNEAWLSLSQVSTMLPAEDCSALRTKEQQKGLREQDK